MLHLLQIFRRDKQAKTFNLRILDLELVLTLSSKYSPDRVL